MSVPMAHLIPESYPNAGLLLPLGSETPKPVPGTGIAKYNTISRPRRRNIKEYAGEDPLQVTFSVILNAWPEGDITDAYGRIYGWAARNGLPTMPTVLKLQGPIPFASLRWIIENVEELESRNREGDWTLCYCEMKLTFTEWNDIDLIVQGNQAPAPPPSPALSAQERFQQEHAQQIASTPALRVAFGSSQGTGGGQPRTYTVKHGDTLSKIAAHELGNANRWRDIANLNALRDPNRISIGQVLKMPS